jgi:hypothetical protein
MVPTLLPVCAAADLAGSGELLLLLLDTSLLSPQSPCNVDVSIFLQQVRLPTAQAYLVDSVHVYALHTSSSLQHCKQLSHTACVVCQLDFFFS